MSIRERIAGVYDQWSGYDKASWLSHFIVAGWITYIAGWGIGFDVAAKLTFFVIFVPKEILNGIKHWSHGRRALGWDGWLTDGIGDLIGPGIVLWAAMGYTGGL